MAQPTITVPQMCQTHQYLLTRQAGIGPGAIKRLGESCLAKARTPAQEQET